MVASGAYMLEQNQARDRGQLVLPAELPERRAALRRLVSAPSAPARCVAARDDITDGANDKQIDAIIVDDDERRVLIIQGKFIDGGPGDGEPLREVLGAWIRLQDTSALQKDANEKLKLKLEAVRRALEDEYRVDFELLTTGSAHGRREGRSQGVRREPGEVGRLRGPVSTSSTRTMLQLRLAEAEAQELPSLDHTMMVDPNGTLFTKLGTAQTILTVLPLKECLTPTRHRRRAAVPQERAPVTGHEQSEPGDARSTIDNGDRVREFFFYHNGVTALCDSVVVSEDKKSLKIKGLSVVNGCQSLTTIYQVSESVGSPRRLSSHPLPVVRDSGSGARGPHQRQHQLANASEAA